jgi:hypothetical protein
MTTQTKPSKNRRRKDRRSDYHKAINAVSRNPENRKAIEFLDALRERYFRYMDGRIDGLSYLDDARAFESERSLVREIQSQILSGNDWVVLHTADLGEIQIKAELFEYVRARRGQNTHDRGPQSPAQRAAAVEHLHERAVAGIRIGHR